jgi:transcriptional regulator with XRE-family HTH domain
VERKKLLDGHLGTQIKKSRESAGYTQDGLAELIGMSPQNLSEVERGFGGISVPMLKKICQTLFVSSDSLLMDDYVRDSDEELAILMDRLKHLSPRQRKLALNMNNNLFEAFAVAEKDSE